MNLLRQTGLILLLSMIAGVLTAVFHPRAPEYAPAAVSPYSRSLADLSGLEPESILWVDARPQANFAAAHIPGAIHLNEDDWEDGFERLMFAWMPGQILVVYCDAAACHASEAVAQRLRQDLGTDEVFFLEGGWQAWEDAH